MYFLLYSILIFLIILAYGIISDGSDSISFIAILISINVLSIIAIGDYYNNRKNSYKWLTLFLIFTGCGYYYRAIELIIFQEFEYWTNRGAFLFNSSYKLFGLTGPFILYISFGSLMFYAVYCSYAKLPDSIFFIKNKKLKK